MFENLTPCKKGFLQYWKNRLYPANIILCSIFPFHKKVLKMNTLILEAVPFCFFFAFCYWTDSPITCDVDQAVQDWQSSANRPLKNKSRLRGDFNSSHMCLHFVCDGVFLCWMCVVVPVRLAYMQPAVPGHPQHRGLGLRTDGHGGAGPELPSQSVGPIAPWRTTPPKHECPRMGNTSKVNLRRKQSPKSNLKGEILCLFDFSLCFRLLYDVCLNRLRLLN